MGFRAGVRDAGPRSHSPMSRIRRHLNHIKKEHTPNLRKPQQCYSFLVYARPLVEQRIELAEKELGFKLERHTPSEIDDFNSRLEEKYVDAYAKARQESQKVKTDAERRYQLSLIGSLHDKLSGDEIRWMKNERALCMCDCEYFLTSYYYIRTQTKIIRFSFRAGQRIYYNVIQELHLQGAPIEIIMAKARQLGISTVTEGIILHSVNFGYGVNAVVASADPDKTGKMAKMTLLGYDSIPFWMKVPYTRKVESDKGTLDLRAIRSAISFQHGSQTSGMARGDTVLKYHLSEVASYTNAREQIEASLWKCVHPDPEVFGALESSAEENTGWFYDNYWDNKRRRARGVPSRLFALFLPFTVAPDQYPNATWIRINPVPSTWVMDVETHAMMKRAKLYVQTNPVLEKVLGEKWECPREVAWYWECHYLEARAKGTGKLWFQEMPVTDEEAFQSKYESVFGKETIAEAWSTRETKYHSFAIVGQSIEQRYEPEDDEIDPEGVIVPVKYTSRVRQLEYRWEMQPVLWHEAPYFKTLDEIRFDETAQMNKFFVYLEPERGYDYSMGVRTGNGIGVGDTVVSVARRGRDTQEPDIQVAEFRSDEVSHVEAYAWCLAIAAYYAKYMGRDEWDQQINTKREPYCAIEQMQQVGDTCQLHMRKMGYRRFHKMIRYDVEAKNMKKSKAHRIGWFSSGWSTPMYTDSFVTWVRNGWFKVNSPFTIREMEMWEQRETASGKAKYTASEEWGDAGLLANAMAAFCVNDLKPMAERTLKRCYDGRGGSKPKLDVSPSPMGTSFPVSEYNGMDAERILRGRRIQF